MKKLIVIFGCAAVALTGCASRRVADVEAGDIPCMPGVMSLDARHAHLKSILGIDDAALPDTNRFVLGVGDYSQVFRLDKPFGGFAEARVYLDRMEDSRLCTVDGKPHRLRSVELKRLLPDDATDKEAVSEWQSACDLVADMLEVESPKVRIVDIEKWRKAPECLHGLGQIRSRVTFDLSDNQDISVSLTEPAYVMRNGRAVVICPGYVEIDLMYNRSLCLGGIGRLKTGDEDEKVELEIDFGPDCRDRLAEALKVGIERRAKRAKRKPAKEEWNKAK